MVGVAGCTNLPPTGCGCSSPTFGLLPAQADPAITHGSVDIQQTSLVPGARDRRALRGQTGALAGQARWAGGHQTC